MNYELLTIFIILNIANVIIQTVKSIATINCGKWVASITNAVAYGLYTIVVVYMVCDLPLMLKAGIIAVANLIGVYVVKLIEEKTRKDKLWKVEVAVPTKYQQALSVDLQDIPHNYNRVGKWVMFNFYCATQKDTRKVKDIAKQYGGKISAYESKQL
jgi:uncharacterized protein YebE (UPF0316 family)